MKQMKIAGGIVAVVLMICIGVYVWYTVPSKQLFDIDEKTVEKIEIFDGNLGVELEITDSERIERLMGSWNQAYAKKKKPTEPVVGIGILVDIYLENGDTEHFEITGRDYIKKDGYIQHCTKGSLEYDYIKEMTEAEDEKELVSHRIDVDKVEKIEIFDGNLGVEVEITKESDVERLMDSWRAVWMKKEKSSEGYIGMGMRTCIYLKNGDVEKFDIRSEDKVEKDGFFYEVVSGSTEYDYIRELTKAQDALAEQG